VQSTIIKFGNVLNIQQFHKGLFQSRIFIIYEEYKVDSDCKPLSSTSPETQDFDED